MHISVIIEGLLHSGSNDSSVARPTIRISPATAVSATPLMAAPSPSPTPWSLPALTYQADMIAEVRPGILIGKMTGFGFYVQRLEVQKWLKRPNVLTATMLSLVWGPIDAFMDAHPSFRNYDAVIVFLQQGQYLSDTYGDAYYLMGVY